MRGRLTVGTMVLVAAGLLAGDVTAYLAVRAFLADRVDRNLTVVAERGREAVLRSSGEPVTAETVERLMPSDVYLAMYDANGRQVFERSTLDGATSARTAENPVGDDPVTLESVPDGDIRAVGITLPDQRPMRFVDEGEAYEVTRLVVGISRADDSATLRNLVHVEIACAAVILLFVLLASRGVLSTGLAPLRSVVETARQIGRGDLGRRLPVGDPRTEVGAVSFALNQAFDQREASESRLRRFVADASHELRTPLSTIHGWADLYVSGGIDDWDGIDDAMTHIRAESQRMSDLVDQLLTLARLDAHEPLSLTFLDLSSVCAQAVADLQITTRTHDVTIHAGRFVEVAADATALRRVVDNLLTNAVHHTPDGTEVEVHVADGASGATLTVVDHGGGLTDAQRTRAFERFWRADAQRAAPGGTGLGLAITRDIVVAHGGTISLSETDGGGLTVTVHFDARAASSRLTSPDRDTAPGDRQAPHPQ